MERTPSLGFFIFIPLITRKSLRFLNPEHQLYEAIPRLLRNLISFAKYKPNSWVIESLETR